MNTDAQPYWPAFSASDIINLALLAGKLTLQSDAVSLYLWARLSENTRGSLKRYATDPQDHMLRGALAQELDSLLQREPIYEFTRFRRVRLSQSTSELLDQSLETGRWDGNLNRLLLADAYPRAISRYQISILLIGSAFHRRNFRSLFDFIESEGIRHTLLADRDGWNVTTGDYDLKSDQLSGPVRWLATFDQSALFEHCHLNVRIFDVVRFEILKSVLVRERFRNRRIPGNARMLFDLLYVEARDLLLLNMAAAVDMLNFWRWQFSRLPGHSHCCIFSGASIPTNSLMHFLRPSGIRVMLMENFFTGHDYYCEEKYEPIPNNSDLGSSCYYQSIQLPHVPAERDRWRLRALNKVLNATNKNVRQPRDEQKLEFKTNAPVAAVIGQVITDYSILCTPLENLNALIFYKELIAELLSATDLNIVFKAHPWERQKQGVNQPLTKDVIERFRADELEERDRERLQIVEGFNIHGLFDQSDYVLTLSSQASLEAAMCGLKPVQFGKAFYGHKGFTHDYDSVCKFVADLVAGNVSGKLTLEEYDCFEEFLMKALEFHLVSAHRSGVRRLKAIFIPKRLPRLSAPIMSGLAETFTPQPSSPAANYFTDIVLTTHEGKPVRFYADLLKGQIVVINVFCFGCCGSCEATMGFLKCLHRHSGAARGTKIRFLSISVDPKNSTPEKLKSYATALEVEPGWSFLTGDKETIGFVLGKLGVRADEREHHSGVLIVGGESAGVWKKSRDAAPSHEIQKAIEAVVDSGKFDALTVSLFEDLKIEVINT
jgi:cytochrome oxidase Cu insertion factor (SCO1/SenC/PrrC family)